MHVMSKKDIAKKKVAKLVNDYRKVISEGRLKSYNEADTKKNFIEPLFKALGWKVDSEEVTAEDRASKGRVDYGFRMNGILQFVLEAKPLKADISKKEYALQAIDYAWHKGCTWAVLCDFENVRLFNAWKKTEPHHCICLNLNCNNYERDFDDLWLLSRESFESGAFHEWAKKYAKGPSKRTVGDQLLEDFIEWRTLLSKDILKHAENKKLIDDEEDMDEAVQRLLDRIVFIRHCEDQKFEEPVLRQTVNDWKVRSGRSLQNALKKLFSQFNDDYDSRLFESHLCDQLRFDDKILADIIDGTYDDPKENIRYNFDYIDADVLGGIYENYLGYILKKTAKRAKVTKKHAHRKEMGIYYTPTYIVDYIVMNTLGKLLEKTAVKDIPKINVLDPACGSGSFLIKAFDVLCDAYEKKTGKRVTYAQKKSILTDNIHGVDLDPKAVEIAKLNLLLKAAEKKRTLPMLDNNIKCGNSLIDDKKVAGDKAFVWEKEFPTIMKKGGFDVVIGNPPYVRQEELKSIKGYLAENYSVFNSMADLFVYFFEKEIQILKEEGYFGMIVSNKWLKAGYASKLREFLKNYYLEKFVNFGDLSIFKGATTYPCITILKKSKIPNERTVVLEVTKTDFTSLYDYEKDKSFSIDQKNFKKSGWSFKDDNITKILNKIQKTGKPLKDYIDNEVYRGILTGLTEAFVIDEDKKKELIRKDKNSQKIIKPFLRGEEARRYSIKFKNRYIILVKNGTDIDNFPAIKSWLSNFKSRLEKRWDKGDNWYNLRSCDFYNLFEKPKIIYGKITTHPRFSIDLEGYYVNDSNFFIPFIDKKLLAILNSKLGWFLISNSCTQVRGGYQLIWKYFGNVVVARKNNPKIEELVDKIISLKKEAGALGSKQTSARDKLEKQIAETDAKIDQLVYKIYGITKKEQKIIEESLK